MRMLSLTVALLTVFLINAFAHAGNVSVQNYGVTNGSSTAYQVQIASTPITVSQVYICDTSGSVIKLAAGNPANNLVQPTDLVTFPVSGCALVPINPYLPAGSSLSIKSSSGSNNGGATTGYNSISLLP